ncbi:MAG: endonuclease/exonuclease/phosphatase family protein [Bdellovibrionota bacterium]
MKIIILTLALSTQLAQANPSALCETNAADSLVRFSNGIRASTKETIQVLTWNVLKFKRESSFLDFVNLSNQADVAFIQEATHSINLQNQTAQKVSMDWTFFKSFCREYGASGVQTGSRYPQIQADAVLAPAVEPVVNTPKVTGFSVVEISGHKVLLINVHGLNANKGLDFEKHMDQIYNVAVKFDGPIIWAGDFNTWNPARMAYLKNKGQALGMTLLVPEMDIRKLKLDHILVRGFKIKSVKILDTYVSSDHWPVTAELEFSP